MRRFRSGTLRSGSVDRPVMGASSAGSYEVTPPGRSRTSDAAHRADGSTQRQQPTRQAYGESDPTGDATPILTGLWHIPIVQNVPERVLVTSVAAVHVFGLPYSVSHVYASQLGAQRTRTSSKATCSAVG
jgi:hypothetical protein